MFESHVEACLIDWTCFDFGFWDFLSNLLLKIIIYWVTNQASESFTEGKLWYVLPGFSLQIPNLFKDVQEFLKQKIWQSWGDKLDPSLTVPELCSGSPVRWLRRQTCMPLFQDCPGSIVTMILQSLCAVLPIQIIKGALETVQMGQEMALDYLECSTTNTAADSSTGLLAPSKTTSWTWTVEGQCPQCSLKYTAVPVFLQLPAWDVPWLSCHERCVLAHVQITQLETEQDCQYLSRRHWASAESQG